LVNQANIQLILDLFEALKVTPEAQTASDAVKDKDMSEFHDACVAANIGIEDTKKGKKLSQALYFFCRRLTKDPDWGWD